MLQHQKKNNMNPTFMTTIENRIKQAPIEIQQGLKKIEWEIRMAEIGKSHKLFGDQMEDLYFIATGLMLGEIHPNEMVYDIEDKLIVEKIEAQKIFTDLERIVFNPLAETILTPITPAKQVADAREAMINKIRAGSKVQQPIQNPPQQNILERNVPIQKQNTPPIHQIINQNKVGYAFQPKPQTPATPKINPQPTPQPAPKPAPKPAPVAPKITPTINSTPQSTPAPAPTPKMAPKPPTQ
jgi:hypothetical protein